MDLYGRSPTRNGSNPLSQQHEWRSPTAEAALGGCFVSISVCECFVRLRLG